ncbi:DoxX family membrane protein [Salinibacterium sp. SWN139]|uniref:DoxX family protein n=1 Tax=Salinibacterium sp. SWN139 TaxID=2792055 RepID=UPI0018CE8C72|nr:DoxX family membrane protein [Salinibacterium sp. SWN139]MBH0052740.1 DoxX family membrane protein [Salinibacterium sp. SWN139]
MHTTPGANDSTGPAAPREPIEVASVRDSTAPDEPSRASRIGRRIGRIALGASLVFAGISHLTFAREDFQAQVPTWQPFDPDFVVVASGVVEIALGSALIFAKKYRPYVGWVAAAFFIAIYPGNISQLVNQVDSLGLDTDLKRWIRMPFQPVLIAWALWSTGAWRAWRAARRNDGRNLGA